MELSQHQTIKDFAAKAISHEDWLIFMRYGLKTLLENQTLLVELMVDEALRQDKRETAYGIPDLLMTILLELELHFAVTKTE